MLKLLRVWFPIVLVVAIGVTAAVLRADPSARATMLSKLGNADPQVRNTEIARLKGVGSSMTSSLLDELDENHSTLVKASIVEAVRKIGIGSSNAGALKSMLQSTDAATRRGAISILCTKPSLARSELLAVAKNENEHSGVRGAAAVAAGLAGAQSRAGLLELLRSPKTPRGVRKSVMRALATCSTSGAEDIASIAVDSKRRLVERKEAMNALCHADAKSTSELASLLESTHAWIRARAALGLAAQDATSKLSAITALFDDEDAEVRFAALQSTIQLGAEDDERGSILDLLRDADPRVVIFACQSIARTSGSNDVPADLEDLLESKNFRVRYEAALALNAHGSDAGEDTMSSDKDDAPNAWQESLASEALSTVTGGAK